MPDNQDEFAGGFTRETLVAFRKAMAPATISPAKTALPDNAAEIAELEKQLEEHKRTCPECQSDSALGVMCAVALDLVIKMFELEAKPENTGT